MAVSEIFKCQICGEMLHEEGKFKQHMFMHQQVRILRQESPKLMKPGTYQCKFCHILFDDKDKLKNHYTGRRGCSSHVSVECVVICGSYLSHPYIQIR